MIAGYDVPAELGVALGAAAILVLLLAVIGGVINRSMQARAAFTRQLAERAALLEKSEERYRLIVDTALDAVVTMDEVGLITDWNAQAEKMFGWARAEALGLRMSETIIPLRYREAHEKGLARFLETGAGPVLNRRIEIIAIRRDGTEFPVELAISPARVGQQWTFSAFLRDLTEREKVAEALRTEEQRYRQLFENVPVGLYRSSPDGRLLEVNPAMVEMLGYRSRESLLATPATALYVNADDRVRFTAGIAQRSVVRDFTARMRRADGREIWVRENTQAKQGPDGTVALWEGTLEDITEAMEAARRLQASERRLTQILEAVPAGIFVADREGHFVFGNESARRILGQGVFPDLPPTAHAKKYQAYVAGTDELYPVERMPITRALHGELASADDVEIRRDGKTLSLSVQAAPLFDDGGNIVGAVTVFTDATERKTLEAQLRQALKMEAVGQLAGGVAHDFNNLLTVILSYGSMLAERLHPSDPNSGDVREMTAAAERAARLTRQLLAFSRKQVLQPQVIDVNSMVTNVETLLRRLIGVDITLQIDLASGIPAVDADPGQLEQVLMNLAVNARDAMPDGGTLRISTAEDSSSRRDAPPDAGGVGRKHVVLTVSDTGSGMSSEVRARVFDPFFTTKIPGEGTGLGLSTVYGIVKQSGGDIRVRSEPGQGTAFDIYLPCADAPPRSAPAGSTRAPRGSETILVVEDDPSLRTLAVRVLKRYGYDVISAASGPDALALSADPRTVVDAVLTDVIMPGMNGREVVERLLAARPGLPYLFMSGYTDDDVLRRGVLHGESAFLQKPFTADQLARKIREVLDGHPRP